MNTYSQTKKRRFVATSIHEQVNDVVQFTISRGVVSLVVGRPGNGKTTSIEHIHEADPNAVLVEYAARFRTSKGLHRAFMDACGWYYIHRNGWDLDVAAEACARDCVQRGRYLLVDEYQNFELQTIRDLLRLNDKFELPIVLVGNFTRLRSTKADAHTLEQITSRIWKKVKLDNPVRQDFIEIGVEFNVEGKAAYEELVVLGHNNNLRELVHVLEVARDLRGPTGSLHVEHLREAVDFLTGGATKNLGLATAGLRTVR